MNHPFRRFAVTTMLLAGGVFAGLVAGAATNPAIQDLDNKIKALRGEFHMQLDPLQAQIKALRDKYDPQIKSLEDQRRDLVEQGEQRENEGESLHGDPRNESGAHRERQAFVITRGGPDGLRAPATFPVDRGPRAAPNCRSVRSHDITCAVPEARAAEGTGRVGSLRGWWPRKGGDPLDSNKLGSVEVTSS